ncbi:transmembrane protein, putative (macronuclear) [Tetrahymena thermophila SB210]|uniref:Transmembrane protein, putative n=1 Tax=Tetrahymena thermophila (strain SB210) TaxID=312017 RepID=Q23G90_TETTS|nr:transmembrane protein, putative [Tetrahymena thermophila SB210]EAR95370.1 transmembrane protein, putative [Tetrahymena thermophila SB210]|eukprot:XP_001015615.1 transmembrane protein, putative [Tetrahymena thermophila SB210]
MTEPGQENQPFTKVAQSINIPDSLETQISKNVSKMELPELQNLKIEFIMAINNLYKKHQLNFQFQNFQSMKIEQLSTIINRIMILLITLVAAFEVIQQLSFFLTSLPLYDSQNVHMARLIATCVQSLFCIYLLLRLGFMNDSNHIIVKTFLCLLVVAMLTGVSVFNNLNYIYTIIDSTYDVITYYTIGGQGLLFLISLYFFLRLFVTKAIKITNVDGENVCYDFFTKSKIITTYHKIQKANI